ncbi:MAG: pilus assembly protein PilZ [Spirochaetales bacterium]|jgi:Tfp pilus assembly protein PilZ|nr:pilus assembly protein PilZ [Spirochaetales bacterium]
MSIVTSQQTSRYYADYSAIEVTFTREVLKAIKLVGKQVFLKCLGYQWPCIIYSSSMVSAKIIVNVKSPILEVTRKANNMVSLRFGFQADKNETTAFYVSAKISSSAPYGADNPDLNLLTLTFTQRPPDDLINALGELLDANVNSKKRRDERIILTQDVMRKMGLKAKETTLLVQGVPRKGIVRDLCFSGAKVIIMGVAKFIVDKEVTMHLELEDNPEGLVIEGKVLRSDPVEGRKDISAFAIEFKESAVPISFKLMLNDYLRQTPKRKDSSPALAPRPAPPVQAAPPAGGREAPVHAEQAPAAGEAPPAP